MYEFYPKIKWQDLRSADEKVPYIRMDMAAIAIGELQLYSQ